VKGDITNPTCVCLCVHLIFSKGSLLSISSGVWWRIGIGIGIGNVDVNVRFSQRHEGVSVRWGSEALFLLVVGIGVAGGAFGGVEPGVLG